MLIKCHYCCGETPQIFYLTSRKVAVPNFCLLSKFIFQDRILLNYGQAHAHCLGKVVILSRLQNGVAKTWMLTRGDFRLSFVLYHGNKQLAFSFYPL